MPLLFRLLAYLPLPLLHNLGALAGWLSWLFSPRYRRHLAENLAAAGLSEFKASAIAEAGKTIFELPKIWLRPQATLRAQRLRGNQIMPLENSILIIEDVRTLILPFGSGIIKLCYSFGSVEENLCLI